MARLTPVRQTTEENPGDCAAGAVVTSGGVRVGTTGVVVAAGVPAPATGWLMTISVPGTILLELSISTMSSTVTVPVADEGTFPVIVTVNCTS